MGSEMGRREIDIQDREDKNNDGPDYPADRAAEAVRKGLHQTGEEVHKARQERIPEDRHRHSYRVWPNGLHWVLCQTHPHPHKQHYCGGLGPLTLCDPRPNYLMFVFIVTIFNGLLITFAAF